MVNHTTALAKQLVPQWRDSYVNYGDLEKALGKVVKVIHKIFEEHANVVKATDFFTSLALDPPTSPLSPQPVRRRLSGDVRPTAPRMSEDGSEDSTRRLSGDLPSSRPSHAAPIMVVVSELEAHRKFVGKLVAEVNKASGFYNDQLLELKFEFIHLVMLSIQLGLVETHQLVGHDHFDPGSTIGILAHQHRHKGINVVLRREAAPVASSHNGLDEHGNPSSSITRGSSGAGASGSKEGIMFQASKTEDSRRGQVFLRRRRLIEAWLLARDPHDFLPVERIPSTDMTGFGGHDTIERVTDPFMVKIWSFGDSDEDKEERHKLIKGLKLDMLEFYRQLLLVQEFGQQNEVTLRKVLKKHRKEVGGRLDDVDALRPALSKCRFFFSGQPGTNQNLLKHLISETEALFIASFEPEEKEKEAQGDGKDKDSKGDKGTKNKDKAKKEAPHNEVTAKERKKAAMRFLLVEDVANAANWGNLFGTWRFGCTVGATLVLLLVMIYISNFENRRSCFECSDVVVSLYRLSGVAALFSWAWAAAATVVLAVRIDYAMVLQYDPRKIGRASVTFFEGLCWFTVAWFFTLASSMAALKGAPEWNVPFPGSYLATYPIGLFCCGLVVCLVHEYNVGSWFLGCIKRIVTAPFSRVTFRDIFIADQFTSLVMVYRDFFFTTCFLLQGDVSNLAVSSTNNCVATTSTVMPAIAILPSTWRFLQCMRRYYDTCPVMDPVPVELPFKDRAPLLAQAWHKSASSGSLVHIYNAVKYSSVYPIVGFSTAMKYLYAEGREDSTAYSLCFAGWATFAVMDIFYKWYWDIVHDWGLGCKENNYLRKRLPAQEGSCSSELRDNSANHLYPIWFYYVAIALDFCLRMTSPFLVSSGYLGVSITSSFVSCMEVCRRGMWNLLRLENRHLAHCREHRARQTKRLEHVEWRLRDKLEKTDRKIRKSVSSSNIEALKNKPSNVARLDVTVNGPRSADDIEMAEIPRSLASPRSDEPLFLSEAWLRFKLRQTQMFEQIKTRPAVSPKPVAHGGDSGKPEALDGDAGVDAGGEAKLDPESGAAEVEPEPALAIPTLFRSATALLRLASKTPRSPMAVVVEKVHNEHDEDAPLEAAEPPSFEDAFNNDIAKVGGADDGHGAL